MRSVDLPPTFHSETFEVGGSFGSSCCPKQDIGSSVMAPISAAAVRNLPPMTGVSSTTAGRGRLGRTEVVDFLAGDPVLAAGFSLSLMTSGVIAQKLPENYWRLPTPRSGWASCSGPLACASRRCLAAAG